MTDALFVLSNAFDHKNARHSLATDGRPYGISPSPVIRCHSEAHSVSRGNPTNREYCFLLHQTVLTTGGLPRRLRAARNDDFELGESAEKRTHASCFDCMNIYFSDFLRIILFAAA